MVSLSTSAAALLALACVAITEKPSAPAPAAAAAAPVVAEPSPAPAGPVLTKDSRIPPRQTIWEGLRNSGLSKEQTRALLATLKSAVDLNRLSRDLRIRTSFADVNATEPTRVELVTSDTQSLVATPADADGLQWTTATENKPVETRLASFSGVVSSTLWSSATSAGMDPTLVTDLAEVFAWVVDFNREVHEDDRWRLTVERKYVDGQPIGWGDIVAAEYENGGVRYTAVRFDHDGGSGHYYTPDGNSLRRMFLRSPLKYGRITSGFAASRFHPILKVKRPHLGIDYGAPSGTPIMAVGDGVVTFAARNGGSGNMITIRHGGLYQTQYKHLSAFAKGLEVGTKVSMGEVIGYVGQTGLATGPHLHYEFHNGATVVDPQGLKFPSANPVPAAKLAAFKAESARLLAELPPWSAGTLTLVPRRGNQLAE